MVRSNPQRVSGKHHPHVKLDSGITCPFMDFNTWIHVWREEGTTFADFLCHRRHSPGLEHPLEKLCPKPVSSVCQEGLDTLPALNLPSPMTLKPTSTAEPGFSYDWSLHPATSFSWCHVAFILSKLPQFQVKNRMFTQKALLKAILCWVLCDRWLWKDPTPPDQLRPWSSETSPVASLWFPQSETTQ